MAVRPEVTQHVIITVRMGPPAISMLTDVRSVCAQLTLPEINVMVCVALLDFSHSQIWFWMWLNFSGDCEVHWFCCYFALLQQISPTEFWETNVNKNEGPPKICGLLFEYIEITVTNQNKIHVLHRIVYNMCWLTSIEGSVEYCKFMRFSSELCSYT